MCGHVGVAAKTLTEPQKKAFYDMLYLDVLRGEHSTGVGAISNAFTKEPKVQVFKSLGSATDFFNDHALSSRTRDVTFAPVSVLMGHNRFATQGKVIAENAHPFEFENLVGAHNGTVDQSSLKDFNGFKSFDIDSKIIFSHLSDTQDLKEVWDTADGAMALVWWDKVTNKLNIIRNAQRPMYICYSEDDKLVMWASELWMIQIAAMRNGIKLRDYIHATPDTLYTFDNKETGEMFHTETPYAPFVPTPKPYYSQRGWYGSNVYDDWLDDEEKPKSSTVQSYVGEKIMLKDLVPDKGSPYATGYTSEGVFVKIHIPLARLKEVQNKIIGRGVGQGYYVAEKLYLSIQKTGDLWGNWGQLSFCKLRSGITLLKKGENGFSVKFESKLYAPWFEKGKMLLQGAYQHRVQCGCTSCLEIPTWEDKEDLLWIDPDNFFCKECSTTPLVLEVLEEMKKKSA